MKRYGNLWDNLTSFENLYLAYRKARRGKRNRPPVERFEFQLEQALVNLRESLLQKTYTPGGYRTFQIYDPKPRTISAAPFPDRVVHHALCNIVEPIYERSFIDDSYACRQGKGTHAAVDRYQVFARKNRYVLKCDVRKFFPCIDHQILQNGLKRKIKDPHVLWLIEKIILSSNTHAPVPGYFPGDNLFTQIERSRGLPIGNQTSQFFANVYLNPLDHFVKEELRCRFFVRYVDDFVLLSNCKEELTIWRDQIEKYLWSLRLWLHPYKRVISRVEDGINFLGYRSFPYHRTLTKEGVRKFRRRLRSMQQAFRMGEISSKEITQRIRSWVGHASQAQTWRLRQHVLGDTIFTGSTAR